MSSNTLPLTAELLDYLRRHSLHEPEVCRQLRQLTAARQDGCMQIAPELGQFLALLVKLIGARRILEVGTFTGYSTLWMATALPSDGKIISCDISEESSAIAKHHWQLAQQQHKIKLQLAPALQTMRQLIGQLHGDGQSQEPPHGQSQEPPHDQSQEQEPEDEKSRREAHGRGQGHEPGNLHERGLGKSRGTAPASFDMIFIDGRKTEYLQYAELSLQLLRQGGLMAVDNTLWDGKVLTKEQDADQKTKAIQDFNKRMIADSRWYISMLPIADGLTLAVKKNEQELKG